MAPEIETPVTTDVANAETAAPAPAPETPAEVTAPAENAAPAPATEEPEKPSKAVSELIAQRKKRQEAEKEAAYWKGVAEGRIKPQTDPAPAAPAPDGAPVPLVAPKIDQFETYEQYEAARDTYLIEKAKHDFRMEQQAEQQRQALVEMEQKFAQRIESAAKEDPAILDLLQDRTLPYSPTMGSIVKDSDVAPQLLRWIDQNRKDAARIAMLPPLQAARELGIVEARIKFASKPEPVRKVSAAPEPVAPVVPSSGDMVDEADLPMPEYYKRRSSKLYGKR
jgi:hypothetical protein